MYRNLLVFYSHKFTEIKAMQMKHILQYWLMQG